MSVLGKALLRRYKAAVCDRNLQREAHRGLTKCLPSDAVNEWEYMCVEWDADGFPKSVANPFHIPESSTYLLAYVCMQSERLCTY